MQRVRCTQKYPYLFRTDLFKHTFAALFPPTAHHPQQELSDEHMVSSLQVLISIAKGVILGVGSQPF